MKKAILVLCAALMLCSCSRSKFTDSKACRDIGDGLCTSLSDSQEYLEFDKKHTSLYFDGEEYDDVYHVYSADTNNINEIGIFHAADEKQAKELLEDCRDYLDDMREDSRAFIASYAPEELPKLDGAEARRFGNYVVYTILPTDSAQKIYDGLKEDLKK